MPSESYTSARIELQRVSTHILARARFAADGRFGLRVTPSGIATPPFGPSGDVVRIAGSSLIREQRLEDRTVSGVIALSGHSLRQLAALVAVDLDEPFEAGRDTPQLGDPDTPIEMPDEATEVLEWLALGVKALDSMMTGAKDPSVIQLWPEHFDVAFDALTAHGRVNLGASPGDSGETEPYLYVGPWGQDRPGNESYWNAPFGATLTRSQVATLGGDPVHAAREFFAEGLRLLG
ncbi:MAG: hypothetical protein ACP5P1_03410 [Acidimicrobiales bacterium]